MASFKAKFPVLQELFAKNHRGGPFGLPPAGRGLMPSREENISSRDAAVQHNFRRMLLVPSREENISSLGAAVQHNFRRTLFVPSREESISSLGAAVQHNFRGMLLVPSREENISSLGAAVRVFCFPTTAGGDFSTSLVSSLV